MEEADVLQCKTITVGGAIYRCQSRILEPSVGVSDDQSCAELLRPDEDDSWEDDGTIEIEERSGQYQTRISVDTELFGYIIGKQGQTIQRIQDETGARVIIPKHTNAAKKTGPARGAKGSSSNSEVLVQADVRSSVVAARTRVELIIESALGNSSLQYTHFLSLPLASKSVTAAMHSFKLKALGSPQDPAATAAATADGIDEGIFWEPKHLHLTLVMLKLYSAQKRELAQKALQKLDLDDLL
ncbi:hypothetical protein CYMTET_33204, partial [Cymbomonas tetramitiformis]